VGKEVWSARGVYAGNVGWPTPKGTAVFVRAAHPSVALLLANTAFLLFHTALSCDRLPLVRMTCSKLRLDGFAVTLRMMPVGAMNSYFTGDYLPFALTK